MKTIDISPPENLSNQYRFQCLDTEGRPVPSSIAEALLDFTPSGNFSSQHVGRRILTVGYFSDLTSVQMYFIMFSIVGSEADSLNRQGQLWSSALVGEDKHELINSFLDGCRTDRLPELFPCLQRLLDPAMHSSQHFLSEFTKSEFHKVKHLKVRLQASPPVMLSTPEGFEVIYQPAERLLFNSFRFHDLVGCSFNGFADSVFDLCILQGTKNSLAKYIAIQDSWLSWIAFCQEKWGSLWNWQTILLLIGLASLVKYFYS